MEANLAEMRTIYHLSNLFRAVVIVSTAHFGESKRSVRCAAGKRSLKSFVMVLTRTVAGRAATPPVWTVFCAGRGIKGSSEVSEGLTAAYQFEQKINSTNARKLLSAVMTSDADIVPDSDNTVLRVRLLGLGSDSCDRTLNALIDELNETQTIFPGTNLRTIYVIPNFSA